MGKKTATNPVARAMKHFPRNGGAHIKSRKRERQHGRRVIRDQLG